MTVSSPPPLAGGAAAVLLALADYETPVWLDAPLRSAPEVVGFVRFHTGAPIVDAPGEAAFAIISDPARMPPFAAFRQGTADYPDRSSTLLIQVECVSQSGLSLAGPGIDGQIGFAAEPLPTDFGAQLADNHAGFPCGVDLVFIAGGGLVALPRSTRLVGG